MKFLPLSLLFVPLMCMAVEEKDFNISVTAQGTMGYNKEFESIGSGKIYSADTLLKDKGGYDKLYQRFVKEVPPQISTGIWQKAESFNEFLQKCNINVPLESIALKMGLDAVFAAHSQTEIDNIAEEMGQHLSFERKISFVSNVGSALNANYDFSRDGGPGVVTMMDMVKAQQESGKAGVCRDMHFAMAQLMVKMGVPNTFIIGTQVVGGGHAVLIAQDPNDPLKSYIVNYGNSTSQTSAQSSSHLLLDGTIPSIAASYRIYDANGKALGALPSGMGMLLNDFLGKNPDELDPMARSESSFGSVTLARGENLSVSLGHGVSTDNDRMTAISARYTTDSEHFPTDFSISLYNMQRDTNLRGKLDVNGLYLNGTQRIQITPIENASLGAGKLSVKIYGQVGIQSNYAIGSLSGSATKQNQFSVDSIVTPAAGTEITYLSNDDKTKVSASVQARGLVDKVDVRDEASRTFDLRDITGTVTLERELSRGVNGYASGTVISRNGLGSQSKQELGFRVLDEKGATRSIAVAHDGQVQGPVLAFVPGSLEKYTVEVSYADKKNNVISSGVFCSTSGSSGKKDCGSRVTGKLKLPLGWDKF